MAPHLVSAYDHGTVTVPGQLAVAAKTNEIIAVRALLGGFDLTGVVVTVDAMHTQSDTAELITNAGGDYVFTAKQNTPTLLAACKKLPWSEVPVSSSVQVGHGRRVGRTIKVLTAPDWIQFAGAATIAQPDPDLSRQDHRRGGLPDHLRRPPHAEPATLADWVQERWGIENRVCWVRDATFDEDASRTGAAPQAMATLRTAINPAPADRRHQHRRRPPRPAQDTNAQIAPLLRPLGRFRSLSGCNSHGRTTSPRWLR